MIKEKNLGDIITPAREKMGLSMHECARRIQISPFHWHQVERGKKNPSIEVLEAISRFLSLDIQDLMNALERTKEKKAQKSADEKEVIRWMRQRKKDPKEVLKHLNQTLG